MSPGCPSERLRFPGCAAGSRAGNTGHSRFCPSPRKHGTEVSDSQQVHPADPRAAAGPGRASTELDAQAFQTFNPRPPGSVPPTGPQRGTRPSANATLKMRKNRKFRRETNAQRFFPHTFGLSDSAARVQAAPHSDGAGPNRYTGARRAGTGRRNIAPPPRGSTSNRRA